MPLEKKLYEALTTSTTLTALTSASIYPIKRVQGGTLPAVVFRRAHGARDYHIEGYSGLENAMVVIDLYTESIDEIIALTDAVIGALSSATAFSMVASESPVGGYDDETRVYERSLNISVWNKE